MQLVVIRLPFIWGLFYIKGPFVQAKISNFITNTLDDRTITGIPFRPSKIRFYCVDKYTGTETSDRSSIGEANVITQFAVSSYSDTTGHTGKGYFDRCLNIKNRVSGNIADVVSANLTAIVDLGGEWGFTLHYTNKESGHKVYWVAEG